MDRMQDVMDAIALYQTQYGLTDTVWGYFSVVTLAMVGFVLGSDKAVKTLREAAAIVVAYLVFCFGNHFALIEKYKQLAVLADLVVRQGGAQHPGMGSFVPYPLIGIQALHISFIAAACFGVLFVARSRERGRATTV